MIKPNYNSVDLAEVELMDTEEIITVSDMLVKLIVTRTRPIPPSLHTYNHLYTRSSTSTYV